MTKPIPKVCQSSISALDFHPSAKVLGVGSLDFSFTIVTCFLEYEGTED